MHTYRCRVALLAIAALALTGLVLLAGDAGAAQKGKKKKTLLNAQLVQQLVNARAQLHMANHDYKGYRAKAAHQVRQAIHALEPKHKHPALPPVKGSNEPQSVSDMQLQRALQILQTVQSQLNGATGQHRVSAYTHVTNAIQDIKTALTIN